MCGVFERRETWLLKIFKKKIYEYDTAIKNCLVHQSSLKIKIYLIHSK